ncbi:MAG TPA: tungstate ABC transporter substrate-binding protein WtpA [Anaerolineales bacterium]|nr:tungstate ABC transporter substrate-binding protein WtpA [Anaerolineales bacterium]
MQTKKVIQRILQAAISGCLIASCSSATAYPPQETASRAPTTAEGQLATENQPMKPGAETLELGETPTAPSPTPVVQRMESGVLRVFCAGSLILPFSELEKAFEAANPEIDVQTEFHGSIQVMRHVTDLHEAIDVVATADRALIPMLMYATDDPDTGEPYADWYLHFAGNKVGLAYTTESRRAGEINAQNWYSILADPGVRFGLADPRIDPSGYRTLMALRLAEVYYGQPGIFQDLMGSKFSYPIGIFKEAGYTEISVPEILEPKLDSSLALRGASIQLVALLQSGDLDYAFEYESVIRQHGLELLELPEAVNLGSAAQAETYRQVEVKLDFQRFAKIQPVFRGEPIGYGITIPSNAPEPGLAEQYIQFLLSEEGRGIMEAYYHPVFEQVGCDGVENMPEVLRGVCLE